MTWTQRKLLSARCTQMPIWWRLWSKIYPINEKVVQKIADRILINKSLNDYDSSLVQKPKVKVEIPEKLKLKLKKQREKLKERFEIARKRIQQRMIDKETKTVKTK